MSIRFQLASHCLGLALTIAAPTAVHAQDGPAATWTDGQGRAVSDTDNRRSNGTLMAMLTLTADDAALRRIWETATATPQLPLTDRVAVGNTVATVIVFTGCKANDQGQCDLRVTFWLEPPNGQRVRLGEGVLWSAAPLTPRFMLGSASAQIGFRQQDRGARMRMLAVLQDRVADSTLELSTPLQVD